MPRQPKNKIIGFQGKVGKGLFTTIFATLNSKTKYRRVKLKSGFTVTESYEDHRKRRYVKNPQAQQGLRIRRK